MFKQVALVAREMTDAVDPQATPSPASLPVFAADKPPARIDRTCDIDIPRAVWSAWKEDGKPREVRRALTPSERVALTKRHGELASALVRVQEDQTDRVVLAISDMFAGFRSVMRNVDPESAVAMIDGMRRMLADLPAWAIEEGCRSIQRGRSGLDHKFMPNDNEIYDVCEALVKPYRERLLECEALLTASIEARSEAPDQLSKAG